MSTSVDRFTIEQAVEDRARQLGHDLKLTKFDEQGNPEWRCVNGCGTDKVRLIHDANGWTLENRPVGQCEVTDE